MTSGRVPRPDVTPIQRLSPSAVPPRRHGSEDRAEIERAMRATKRSWKTLESRIKKLQANGKLPSGVIPPGAESADTKEGKGGKEGKGAGKEGKGSGKEGKGAGKEAKGTGGGTAIFAPKLVVKGKPGGAGGAGSKGGNKKRQREKERGKEEEGAASGAPKPMLEKMGKASARGLKGKFIEIFWDGECEWFEAEV